MRIAQVAPLLEAVPPRLYGGTERVISWLTEALVEDGHEVTLFATGDSETSASHFVTRAEASRSAGRDHAALADVFAHVRSQLDDFDIVHFHTEFAHFGAFPGAENKCLTTLHLRLDREEAAEAVAAHPEMPLVSISNNQRLPLPDARYVATVPHGMPEDLITEGDGSGGYLLFLGRISPDKRPDRAIKVASALGMTLKIAAKVDAADERYFREEIEPLLATEGVEYLGERDDSGKADLLGKAKALLFPIDWPEPFGLVMIEAMAAGTPIVAWRAGSVPEVIEPGVTGRIVESLDEAVDAVRSIDDLPRHRIRQEFERRFTARRMAQDYVKVYQGLIGS
ncbi:Glycosyltransferase involved in cell wall bisynthesis [Kaistia soli DSM 19436]|uniref:Glycosyltransferase involved in cell wall bisynthesis n=1 Tax=Kaistia soli DSM 19436 TaxID=1122133 RepID=A0A1M5J0P3_9HYPH|nr:glycosyltransferase family 4 protein [Kaistia soli]SHG34147.1 Glycosyltransferase involved in cell wall bisynthesis [Kaistia soli DSM 19436]